MQEDTYNAKEAMGKLKLPTTTFYRKVKEGEIPYKGQRPRMRFPKEAIDAIAEIELEEENNELVFKASTVSDVWDKHEMMQQLYGDDGIVPFRTVLAWRKRNDEISMQVNQGTKILGWTTFLPLEEEIILELTADKMKERDVPVQVVRKWEDAQISVFISIIEVVPSSNKRRDKEVAAFLLRKTVKWALTLIKQYDIKNWYGIGTTPEGQAILEALGFKQISSLDGGKRKGYRLEDISEPSKLLKGFLRTTEG